MIEVMKVWQDKNAIMQIYPRSYYDSNGDGVGDLAGIREKLSYLKGDDSSLGVDAIWISPFYPSPMKDFGYDVANYTDVDPIFGSLEDLDALIADAHERGMAVMIDFVPNHSSNEHKWFKAALENPDSPERDYYIFRDAAPDGSAPNNWLSVFGGSAWELDERSGQYYLHSFLPEQPDLNWSNPELRSHMQDYIRFWFDRGVDGLRVDAIRWMAKDPEFRDDPPNENFKDGQDPYNKLRHVYSRYSNELDNYLRSITEVAREYKDRLIVFEDHLDEITPVADQIRRMFNVDNTLSAAFNFQAMHIPFSAWEFAEMVERYQSALPDGALPFYCFSNHDESRVATRFGQTEARMLTVLQLMLPGIPVLYYGQEIGMTDTHIEPGRVRDPFELRVPGKGLGRDPQRTPMQWNASSNAGFSSSDETWLPINDNYSEVNVENQLLDSRSALFITKQLLSLRSKYAELRNADNYRREYCDESVFSFSRSCGTESLLTICNFYDNPVDYSLPYDGLDWSVLISAQGCDYSISDKITIQPKDGVVLKFSRFIADII